MRLRRTGVGTLLVVLAFAGGAVALSQSAGAMTRGSAASLDCGFDQSTVSGVVAEGLGKVDPEEACVSPGDSVELTAFPARGWELDHWDGCTKTDGATCVVLVGKKIAKYTAAAFFTKPSSNEPPKVSIVELAPNPARTREKVQFVAEGTDPEGKDLAYTWSFGDGNQNSGQSVTYAYGAPGDYGVTVTATDPDGGSGSASATVSVLNGAPTASIVSATPNPAKKNETVSFTGAGSDPDGFPVTYAWDFGDGSQGSGSSPSHAFASEGSFQVTLTVADPHGGSAKASVSVSVDGGGNQAPTAAIGAATPNPAQIAETVSFRGTGTDPEGGALKYSWSFGDGGSADGQSASHAYASAGTYDVTLTVTDPQGASAKASTSIVVQDAANKAPSATIASVVPNPAQAGENVLFSGSGTDPEGGALSFAWSFGDGESGSGKSASHVYTAPGSYTATLTVTDPQGASVRVSASVEVQGPGNRAPSATIAVAGSGSAQVGQAVAFTGSGTDPEGGALVYSWSFGDGTSGSGKTVSHAYAAPGTYTVVLTVTDPEGAKATASTVIGIGPDSGGGTGTEIVVGDSAVPPGPDVIATNSSLAAQTSGNGSIVEVSGASAFRIPQSSGAAPGISCGVRGFRCFSDFPVGRAVTLRAIAAPGFAFERWTGACSGTSGKCTVVLRTDRVVGALFVAKSRAVAQVSVRRPQIRVRWQQSVGRGDLVVSGWVSRKAVVRVQLRRPGGGPLVTRVASVKAGRFTLRRKLGPGLLTRGAVVLPGGFVVSLTGKSAGLALPLQVRTIELAPPREGVTRRAFASASQTGPAAKTIAGSGREAWARFVFAAQPRAGSQLSISWYTPTGTLIGTAQQANRPSVDSFMRCDCPLIPGDYRAELKADGRVIKRLLVRVR